MKPEEIDSMIQQYQVELKKLQPNECGCEPNWRNVVVALTLIGTAIYSKN